MFHPSAVVGGDITRLNKAILLPRQDHFVNITAILRNAHGVFGNDFAHEHIHTFETC